MNAASQPYLRGDDLREFEEALASIKQHRIQLERDHPSLPKIARFCRARRLRQEVFGGHASLFGEPSWDMLLYLFVARLERRKVSITTACAASGSPTTTALRHLNMLERRRLVERIANPSDRRASIVRITEDGMQKIEEWCTRAFPNEA